MGFSICRSFLAFLLKFLNFLQTFVGVSIIIYSLWMLNQWSKQGWIPAPSAPSPDPLVPLLLNSDLMKVSEPNLPINFAADMVSGLDDRLELDLSAHPAPWFIYSFMGVGIVLCLITCTGYIAAESINGCCLGSYAILTTIVILLEASLVAFFVFDHHWQKDLPNDPTGELQSLGSFIEDNIGICKWVGVAVVIIQAVSLLVAIILRAMVSSRGDDFKSDDDYTNNRGRNGKPLLNPQSPTSGSTSDNKHHPDIWSQKLREKYGLKLDDGKV